MSRGAAVAQFRGNIVGRRETRVQVYGRDKSLVGKNADAIAQ